MSNRIENSEAQMYDRAAALAIWAVSLAFLLWFAPLGRAVALDPATWDYMSVELARGLVPYRDVFLHKTPAAAFIGAAGAATAPALGLLPVQGAHLLFIILGALGPALLYLVCLPAAGRAAALAAAVFMMGYDQWPVAALEGVRPKVATVVLGLFSLRLAARQRPGAAGASAALATLCWQPGLAFLAGACVPIVSLPRGERTRALVRLTAGAAAPVVLMLGTLAWLGALGDFVDQAVLFNLDYIDTKSSTVGETVRRLYRLSGTWNRPELLLFVPALAAAASARRRFPLTLVMAGAVYVAMMFVSFQRLPDTILLTPFVAATLGIGIARLFEGALTRPAASILAVSVALLLALTPTSSRFRLRVDYEGQAAAMATLSEGLEPDDAVVAVSVPEFLIHSGRRNAWKWPYLWFGVDRFAADHTEGGFDGMLDELERTEPALILVGRRWPGPLRARFEQWARPRYRKSLIEVFPHNDRPLAVYRRRDGQTPSH